MSRDAWRTTLDSLRLARESRDGFPSRFADELEVLVRALCRELDVGPRDTSIALRVVHLHDLGLLAADSSLLSEPRELTDAEREQLSRWPAAASQIARSVPGNEDVAPALTSLGEWWDGSHSPHGLSGDRIPVASRIVAPALAYVAMSRSRPHRPALHPEEIGEQLRTLSGTRYEPRVVEALDALVGRGLS